ncbi:MAG: serine protease [Amycolatopsis sp.]|uniref:S8 family serine peptidase n=1 Tax=Amycolatopsis sp. TaxID=37632 RepID=UPI00262A06B1|nr:S8 family serine peptidase [Amycolatopsis sp.]MCU1684440.1 serine protease [Amycolatopsis sp.]
MTSTANPVSWGLRGRHPEDIPVFAAGPAPGWATGGSTGAGVRVCVVDSGIDLEHPLVGPVAASYAVVPGADGPRVEQTADGDTCGHGTACAGIIREVAPDCELHSVRVLGNHFAGTGDFLLAGLSWAVEQGFDVINLSLSTTRARFVHELREIADRAYFRGTALVASAHNSPIVSFPWSFSSVISVGGHQESDPGLYLYNPSPPVEFFAKGQDVRVAWLGGRTMQTTGNSFATPRIAGLCALALAAHPRLTIFELKTALYLAAANVRTENRGIS